MEDAIRVTRADGQIAAAVDIGPSSATNLLEISAETVTLSAGAQGTTGTVCLDKAPVFNEVGSQIGELSDTSFAFVTGTVLTTEEEWDYTKLDAAQIALLDNGDFRIDYRTGKMLYCKDTAATTDTCNYKSRQTNVEITASTISIGSVTIEDASTSANKADINDADTARTTGTHVLATQSVDAAGAVLSTSALATSAKQLADDHNVTVSNMIPAVETGLATSAKQLADDHNVTVSNMIAPVETGLATSAKQLADGHGVAVADGADVTQGAKADAKDSATDATAISIMQVLKQISFSTQANSGNTEIMDDWDESDRCKSNPIAGQAGVAANRGVADALTQRVAQARDLTVTNATGSGAIATTTAVSANWKLDHITIHLSAAPTTSQDLDISIDANDGAAYDTILLSQDLSASSATDIVYKNPVGDLILESGDEIKVAYTNTDGLTYGLRVVGEKI